MEQQSEVFLERLKTRKRNPAKAATLKTYSSILRNHVIPAVGSASLETFGNGAMRAFAQSLSDKGLSPKTVLEVISLTKQVIGSAVNDEGEQLFKRVWNHEFIDLPTISSQKRPTVTPEQLAAALKTDLGVFYAFLAGTGLRIGEALATRYGWDGKHTGWSPATASVDVRTSLWRGTEQAPKTPSSVRLVDLDPRLNDLLVAYTASRTLPAGEFLFQSGSGSHLYENNVREYSLEPLGIKGFHAFRRFRITRLRELGVPEDIIRYWAGHAGAGITDRYSKLAENIGLRQRWAVQAGLGFDLPKIEREVV